MTIDFGTVLLYTTGEIEAGGGREAAADGPAFQSEEKLVEAQHSSTDEVHKCCCLPGGLRPADMCGTLAGRRELVISQTQRGSFLLHSLHL